MTKFEFVNPEYQADGSFEQHKYVYEGDREKGWTITRDGALHMQLGPGYTPVQTKYCGVCSTDLARRFLPYPLPQIIGHEVVGTTTEDGTVVVEINASEHAREVHSGTNPYDNPTMHTHDPLRVTLGINQLPGGFSPVVLAPVHAVVPVPSSVSTRTAALTEPFAAALQGVEATVPCNGDAVAVLGPRRLGALILAALAGYRHSNQLSFDITALARHERLLELSQKLGADAVVNLLKTDEAAIAKKYDIVFDTTGKPEGFALALKLAKRVVHLKSTNGQEVQGLKHLTDLVVDEMALLPFAQDNLSFRWPLESNRPNLNVFCAPDVPKDVVEIIQSTGRTVVQADMKSTYEKMTSRGPLNAGGMIPDSPFPRFDLAVASSLAEVDSILRPEPGQEISLVRARGAILLVHDDKAQQSNSSLLWDSITSGGMQLHSSRCGNFARALSILEENPSIAKRLEEEMISHTYALDQIEAAFEVAADSSQSIKVLVETGSKLSI